MLIIHVNVFVRNDCIQSFIDETKRNAVESRKEAGVKTFDILQSSNDPANFLLIEVYLDQEAADLHKKTEHYLKWRESVTDMMAVPRVSKKYLLIDTSEIPD